VLSRDKARREESWGKLEKAFNNNEKVHGVIFNQVKGGFTVRSRRRGGLPAALAGRYPTDPRRRAADEQFAARSRSSRWIAAAATSWCRAARFSKETRAEQRQELVQNLEEGQVIDGVVKNITDYGAFVDLGGIDGLLHVTISWRRVNQPDGVLTIARP